MYKNYVSFLLLTVNVHILYVFNCGGYEILESTAVLLCLSIMSSLFLKFRNCSVLLEETRHLVV